MLHDTGARDQAWDKNLQLLLVGIIAFNVLPHLTTIPLWCSLIAFALLGWKVLFLFRGVPRPPRWVLYILSAMCAFGVFREYDTIFGQEPASALLVTLASAKLLETNRYRDAMFVIFTSFFLLMAHLLDSQSILTTIYMGLDVMLITALMFQLHKQERRRSARSFRPVMKTLALAIPVWVFLFIVFPRFSGGAWGAKDQAQGGGEFSENLDPGGIEAIADSDEIAFRVTFSGLRPSPEEMYWRGGILTESNGLIWTKGRDSSLDVIVPGPHPQVVDYQVYLEPRFNAWMFTLDYPASVATRFSTFRRRPGFIYEHTGVSSGQLVFEGHSTLGSAPQRLLDQDRTRMLQLPKDVDPRVVALSRELLARDGDYAANVLKWFDEQGFRYTKSPGALRKASGSAQLAQFLFETHRGFCEHYAAAFATLMRLGGVPARVTIGFQGASKNQFSDYFVVRDMDAHAWTELWKEDTSHHGLGHWVRVDPTATIAPLRLQMGGDFNLLDPSTYSRSLTTEQARLSLDARNSRYVRAAAAFDALQMKWNAFLNDYDFEKQKSFFEKLGLGGLTRWALFSIALIGVGLFSSIVHWVLRRRSTRVDPVVLAWRRLCAKLERAGVARRANEGPLDFTSRAATAFPQESDRLRTLGSQYATLRYGPSNLEGVSSVAAPSSLAHQMRDQLRDQLRDQAISQPPDLRAFKRAVRELSLKKS